MISQKICRDGSQEEGTTPGAENTTQPHPDPKPHPSASVPEEEEEMGRLSRSWTSSRCLMVVRGCCQAGDRQGAVEVVKEEITCVGGWSQGVQ